MAAKGTASKKSKPTAKKAASVSQRNDAATSQTAQNGHTAVIYFHGMGSQRRYEETSRLIDSMDAYLSNCELQRNEPRGAIANLEPRSEPHYKEPDDTVTYIDSDYLKDGFGSNSQPVNARFYEVYWAPIMAGASSPRRVAWWIVRQVPRPIKTLLTPWRERQRLRRAALADLRETPDKWPPGVESHHFDKLLDLYTGFENLEEIRSSKDGKYETFIEYVRSKNRNEPDQRDSMIALTDEWFDRYKTGELCNAFVLTTLLLALVMVFGLLAWFVLQALQFADMAVLDKGNLPFKNLLEPQWSTAIGLVVSLVLAAGFGKFLTDYMGDVEAWATYQETDENNIKRQRVLARGVDLIAHALADPKCKRAIVVSHSLGTTVAHDTLLAIRRLNQASNRRDPMVGTVDLSKIRHFVTIASPIDKINYFFESARSKFHRYTRVVETLRGDIGNAPFSRNAKRPKPHIHWVNYFDEADLISGGLHSPVNRSNIAIRVDNVHVSNLYFPNPGAAHSAYFENRRVISDVFEMIYLNQYNYENLPLLERNPGSREKYYDYDSVALGPGDDRGGAFVLHVIACAVPWTSLVAFLFYFFSLNSIAKFFFVILLFQLAVLAGSWIFAKSKGNKMPL